MRDVEHARVAIAASTHIPHAVCRQDRSFGAKLTTYLLLYLVRELCNRFERLDYLIWCASVVGVNDKRGDESHKGEKSVCWAASLRDCKTSWRAQCRGSWRPQRGWRMDWCWLGKPLHVKDEELHTIFKFDRFAPNHDPLCLWFLLTFGWLSVFADLEPIFRGSNQSICKTWLARVNWADYCHDWYFLVAWKRSQELHRLLSDLNFIILQVDKLNYSGWSLILAIFRSHFNHFYNY